MPSRPTNLAKRRACQASPGSVDSERRTKPLRWNIRRRFLHRIVVESRDLVAAHALGALWIVGAQAFHTPITPSIILASDALFQGVSIAGFGVAQTSKISSGCICRARSPSALIPTLFKRGCRATQASIVRAGNPITSTDQSVRSIYLNVRYGETNYRAWKFMEMSKCQRKAESTSM